MSLEIILSIIGTLLAILGIPQLFGYSWKNIIIKFFYGGISWNEVERLTSIISEKINNKKPDLIIGVGRGGIISAGLLCSKITNDGSLDRKGTFNQNEKSIKIETVNTVKKIDESKPSVIKREVRYPFYYEVQNIDFDLSIWVDKTILIIIGETVTGHTLKSTKDQIESLSNQNNYNIDIKIATLVLHSTKHQQGEGSPISIDYIAKTYKQKIIMPWKH